jgi:hypothetical protein
MHVIHTEILPGMDIPYRYFAIFCMLGFTLFLGSKLHRITCHRHTRLKLQCTRECYYLRNSTTEELWLDSRKVKRFLSFPNRTDRPTQHSQWLFPRHYRGGDVKLFAHLHLVQTLKKRGVKFPFPHTPSCRAYWSTMITYLSTFKSKPTNAQDY